MRLFTALTSLSLSQRLAAVSLFQISILAFAPVLLIGQLSSHQVAQLFTENDNSLLRLQPNQFNQLQLLNLTFHSSLTSSSERNRLISHQKRWLHLSIDTARWQDETKPQRVTSPSVFYSSLTARSQFLFRLNLSAEKPKVRSVQASEGRRIAQSDYSDTANIGPYHLTNFHDSFV